MKKKEFEKKYSLLTGKGMWHTNDCNGMFPKLLMTDGPHGLRKQDEGVKTNNDSYISTCYPTASCLGATFDKDLVARVADSLGKEAWNADVSVLLGPGINMKRSPLCGRNFEYFSEDPFLSGELGAAYINAVQKNGVGTSLKHFAANSQETKRMTSDSRVDERTLREIYLAAFEKCVKNAKPATVMVSYNYLNGYKATENRHLLKDILREDWDYDGVTVSDWGACIDLTASVKAGLDLEMPGSGKVHLNKLKNDLKNGKITEEEIDPAINRIKALIERFCVRNREDSSKKKTNAYDVALEAALKGAVLLKNEGNILPLDEGIEINVIGELARTVRFQGGGSSHINAVKHPNILEELKKAGFKLNFAPGYLTDTDREDATLKEEALKLLRNKKVTIFCGGLTDYAEGEGYDRKTLDLPRNQVKLFEEIKDEDVVFVSFGGSAFTVPFIDKVKAMLHMHLGGEAVSEALVRLLKGEVNPSGRLAETWPLALSDTPAYSNFATDSKTVPYKEGLLVGYRHYDTLGIKPLFPFGYGLSYTTFEYTGLRLFIRGVEVSDATKYSSGETDVFVKVKNTGMRAGAETVQVYVENPDDGFLRARHELRGFEKVYLEPGEEREVKISLDERAFSVFDTSLGAFNVSAGVYGICVGDSIASLRLTKKLKVEGKDYASDPSGTETDRYVGRTDYDPDRINPGEYSVYNSLSELAGKSWLGKAMLKIALKVSYSMFKDKPADDPEVLMTVETIKDGPIDCIMLQGGIPYAIAEMIVRQANRRKR